MGFTFLGLGLFIFYIFMSETLKLADYIINTELELTQKLASSNIMLFFLGVAILGLIFGIAFGLQWFHDSDHDMLKDRLERLEERK